MNECLWQPSVEQVQGAQITQLQKQVERDTGVQFADFSAFHRWTVENSAEFWSMVWDDTGVIGSKGDGPVLRDGERFPGAQWFPESRLNFAENLLWQDDQRIALVGRLEAGHRRTMTYRELRAEVARVSGTMRAMGVREGDRVAGYLPNIIETVVAMLATTSIGAIWSSCSPDFGMAGARDRFSQIAPKWLFAVDGYRYNGKWVDTRERVAALAASLPSLEQLVMIAVDDSPCVAEERQLSGGPCVLWESLGTRSSGSVEFLRLSFNHPLYIMYSSGTTGTPKCIVHGAGGTLLQHKKEHVYHTGLTASDVLFYFTTCGWMMWNWLVSGLATGATLVLYEGSPFGRRGRILPDLIDEEQIAIFGVGAKYIDSLERTSVRPRQTHDLKSLRTILSTGSPLNRHSYEFIYRDFKADVCLSSISGGTDIISCFVLGNPALPVYNGEIQCLGLGMGVDIWNEQGESVRGGKGELVCTKPFPSAPIGFWNDDGDEKYRASYFSRFEQIWAHGDFGEITEQGGVIIHGRSDATLNPGGVRIGTAEIYRQVEKIETIVDSVVIGQQFQGDERVILFVAMEDGVVLDDALVLQIKNAIRDGATPRHVPAKIIAVPAIPRTISGKVVELAVKQIVHNQTISNRDALANPEALDYFAHLEALQN